MILYDGVFRFHRPDIFYTPTTGGKKDLVVGDTPTTKRCPNERANNKRIRNARSIIEHYFGRMKTIYPMFEKLTFRDKKQVADYVIGAAVLVNMGLIYSHPLRETVCTEEALCYHCLHLAD